MSRELPCDPAFVKLFEQDALLRKKLRHENASRVEDIGEADDGCPFIVMENVAGQSLKKYIEQGAPFAPLRACAIARQIAAGLEAAHASDWDGPHSEGSHADSCRLRAPGNP